MNIVNSNILPSGERIPKRFVYTEFGAELFDKNIFSQKSGIYMLTNAFDGKRYIGQSSNLYQRICGHASSYKNLKTGGDRGCPDGFRCDGSFDGNGRRWLNSNRNDNGTTLDRL